MKHFFIFSAFLLSCLAVSAGYTPQTITWNLKDTEHGGIGSSIPKDGTWYDYNKNDFNYAITSKRSYETVTEKGIYCNNVDHSGTTYAEFIKVILPPGVKGNVAIQYTSNNAGDYAFYYFCQSISLTDPDFKTTDGTNFDNKTFAATETKLLNSFNLDLRKLSTPQVLYLYTKTRGGRFTSITWNEIRNEGIWDFSYDADTTTKYVNTLNNQNRILTPNGEMALAYYAEYESKLTLASNVLAGPWWHNSGSKDGTGDNKKDNAFELTVAEKSVGTITLKMTSTTTGTDGSTAQYKFYVFTRNKKNSTRLENMYLNTNLAINSGTWVGSSTESKTFTMPVNLLNKDSMQILSLIFLQTGGKEGGLRVQEIKYTYNIPLQGLDIKETDKQCVTSKLSSSTNLKAYITRTELSSSNYNTICLPFSMDADQITAAFGSGCKLYTLSSKSTGEGGVITLNFTSASTITEGKPYLIKPAADIDWTTPLYGTTTGSDTPSNTAVDGVTFYGAYTPTQIETTDYFLGTNDLLYHPIPTDRTIKGLRGYFRITNPSGAPVRMAFNQTDTPTNLENQFTDSPVHRFTKIIKDGQLLIENNGTYIDLMGRTIK